MTPRECGQQGHFSWHSVDASILTAPVDALSFARPILELLTGAFTLFILHGRIYKQRDQLKIAEEPVLY
jgi:hypothetical protein